MKENKIDVEINLSKLKKRSPHIVFDKEFFTEEITFTEFLNQELEKAKEREQIKNVVISKVGSKVQVIFEEVK